MSDYKLYPKIHAKWHEMRSMANKRGIGVESVWENDFSAFLDWMDSHGFEPGMKIVRLDKSKPYGPDNCELQPINATYRGKSLEELAKELNTTVFTIYKYKSQFNTMESALSIIEGQNKKKELIKAHPDLYSKWNRMCANAKHKFHHDHVGWICFAEYVDWCLDNGWKPGLFIVRKDPKGLYTPDNCEITDNRNKNVDYSAWKRKGGKPRKLTKEELMKYQRERQKEWYWKHREEYLEKRRRLWNSRSPEQREEYNRRKRERYHARKVARLNDGKKENV